MVSWRDEPTRYDIEALQANTRRVGLVIRVRWALVAALAFFSLLAGWIYALEFPWSELWPNMVVPALALVFVLLYNTFYQLTYKRLGNIAILNHMQLLFDVLVVTVLVYYSGGVYSWFWTMYSLFILEAAFILPKRWHVWLVAGVAALASGLVYWGEYAGILPHVTMPFVVDPLYHDFTYVAVRYLWQLTVLSGTAIVATLMTATIRAREAELAESSIVDEKTGLYDRRYLLRSLSSELLRAQRDHRPLHVLLADIDHFGTFNKLVGIEAGDEMLVSVATALANETETPGTSNGQTNVVGRFGGEEFGVVLVERPRGGYPSHEDAVAIAERMRAAAEALRVEQAGVTVSMGLASFPEDGQSADELLNVADERLHDAIVGGGNRVSSS
jgi:diguanylate cyclase (GGDEF)-like protein